MTKKFTHTLYAMLAAGAIAAVPALSAAEGEKQEGQKQGQQGQQGQQQQGQQQQGQQKITKKLTLNESMTLPLANGCSYSATINGTVTPVKGEKQQGQAQQGQQGQQHVNPELQVTASVICPNQATLTVSENVTRTGALTHKGLEEALERRGTIFTGQQGRQCAFVPDFELIGESLEGIGVAYMCAMGPGQQGQQQQRQGG